MGENKRQIRGLFRNEYETIERAEAFLEMGGFSDEGRHEFDLLLEGYRKLLRATGKMTRMNDSNQRKLHNALSQINAQKEELQMRKEHLRKLNRAKDEILGIVAHDLRTPVNTAHGYSEILADEFEEVLGPEGLHVLGKIKKSCTNMNTLINDLLEVAKLEGEDFELPLADAAFSALVRENVGDFRAMAARKNLTLVLHLPEKDHLVPLNRERFRQICENLLSNAIKFTNEGGRIDVTVLFQMNRARLCIRDTGIGIPKNFLPHLFDKFTVAGRKGTGGEASTGLGMSIIQNLVLLHQGRIWVESEEGVGTSFFIEIPMSGAR
ncbi:sensor histidine kinase [Acanthopleuribacter pedis]|uniref:histidine kinase n=1 Tax=Acanthopleuribacter pedis TaxID=442870 RepID=A0A8J7Q6Y9_9BACT|nr:HAMP domain-containing sensor histidine kinase [Acanthopleuribacter pedis]MBO1319755.1 HAMP domain-containing histidine kinase [Acanthopleuribacter pedis]